MSGPAGGDAFFSVGDWITWHGSLLSQEAVEDVPNVARVTAKMSLTEDVYPGCEGYRLTSIRGDTGPGSGWYQHAWLRTCGARLCTPAEARELEATLLANML